MSGVVYCPRCSHRVMGIEGHVVRRTPDGARVFPATFVACTGCAMTSEVGAGGVLLDLGQITVADLQWPPVACDEHTPPVFIQDHANLLTMKES
jgi:hypothetical protein